MSEGSDFNSLVQSCSEKDNGVSSCSPQSSDVWVNGTQHYFIWKYNNPFYVSSTYLDIYLYYIINYAYVNVKTLSNLTTSTGGVNVTVDDSWFLTTSTTDQNLTMYAYMLPSTENSTEQLSDPNSQYPLPFNFTVTQIAIPSDINTTSSTNNTSTNTSATPDDSLTTQGNARLPGWAIAVIVIAIVALLCGGAALIWTLLVSRKNKDKCIPIVAGSNNEPQPNEKMMLDTTSTHSQTPIYRSADSVMAGSSIASPITHLESLRSLPIEEEDEETHRRKIGEALMQRQLEEDGTFVKHAGRFTRIKSLADVQKSAIAEHPHQ